MNSVSLLNLFNSTNINDTERVMQIIDNFQFITGESQAELLDNLRRDLNVRHNEMINLFQLSRGQCMKIINGSSLLKPAQIRSLLLHLLVRESNPELFDQLIAAPETRFTAQFDKH